MASSYEVIFWVDWTEGKLHEAEHHSTMRAAPDGSRFLDGDRVSWQLPQLPNKKSSDSGRAE
jgi:hypothetical protein